MKTKYIKYSWIQYVDPGRYIIFRSQHLEGIWISHIQMCVVLKTYDAIVCIIHNSTPIQMLTTENNIASRAFHSEV